MAISRASQSKQMTGDKKKKKKKKKLQMPLQQVLDVKNMGKRDLLN